jgi:hypothetical protein
LDITKKILEYDREKTIDGKKERILQKDPFKSGKKNRPSYWINEVETLYNPDMVHEIQVPEFILGSLKHSFNTKFLTDLRDKVFERNIKTKDFDRQQDYLLLTESRGELWDAVFPQPGGLALITTLY